MTDVLTELKTLFGERLAIDSDTSYPVAHVRYRGNEENFITYQLDSGDPAIATADDVNIFSNTELDVDIYNKGNYIAAKNKIIKLLTENGWNYFDTSPEMYEEDENLFHITLTFKKGTERYE